MSAKSRGNWNIGSHLSDEEWERMFPPKYWCNTCGKATKNKEQKECPTCKQWWKDNNPNEIQ
jgi:rubrerythrin